MKNLGLDSSTIVGLQQKITCVIHAASSINLRHNLSRIAPIIVQGTLNVADFALGCRALGQFVYISTAYANSHLHYSNPKTVPQISERIYPLATEGVTSRQADLEWAHLQEHGTTAEYEAHRFPWAYAYAKHLTERLLISIFQTDDISETCTTSSLSNSIESDSTPKLLIIRPSIIGPAESFPKPDWQVAFSAPVTGFLAFLILTPAKRLTFYSQFNDPSHEAFIDEVPVDVVANRIITHTFMGTSGIVHANRELSSCYSFAEYVQSAQKLRRLPWKSKIVWHHDPTSPKLCEVARLYQVSGCTYNFQDNKTLELWSVMRDEDKSTFPLFATASYGARNAVELSGRDDAFRSLFAKYFKRRKWPEWALPMFYHNS